MGEKAEATDLLHDTLLRADREPILELVLREIDLWKRLFVLDLPNSFFDVSLRRRHVCVWWWWTEERSDGLRRYTGGSGGEG